MDLLDEQPHEIEVGLRGRRKTDLDLLEAHPHQDFEEAPLAMDVHRVDERLVAVAQVDAAPCRCLRDRVPRPASIGQVDWRKGPVFSDWHSLHGITGSPVGLDFFDLGK